MLLGTDAENALTERIIGCAMEVHKELGPGLLESVYEAALCNELRRSGLSFRRQVAVPLYYKGELISEHRVDLVVDDRVVVEVKSVIRFEPVFTAQLLTYLKVMKMRIGLLLNFNSVVMKQGIRRVMK
jgi:GxxExxY protein